MGDFLAGWNFFYLIGLSADSLVGLSQIPSDCPKLNAESRYQSTGKASTAPTHSNHTYLDPA